MLLDKCDGIAVQFSFRELDFQLLKNLGKFTFFIFLNQIIDQINWSIDKFVLGRYSGTTAIAIYGVGAQINTLYVNLSSSISSVFVPQVNRIVAETDDNHALTKLLTRVGRVQFLLLSLILSGLIFWGKEFILIWAGEDYGQSYVVMLLLIIADLWGISKIAPEIYDKKGANLVIIRSIKGSNLFNRIKQRLITKKITYEEGVKYNSPEYKSVQKPQNRESFYADLNNIGFEQLLPKYLTRFRTIGKIKNKIKRIVDAICGGGINEYSYAIKFYYLKINH